MHSEAHRRALGQVFTPHPLCEFVCRLALADYQGGVVLDPSCGDGRFLAVAARLGVNAHSLAGVEIDDSAFQGAVATIPGAHIVKGDFFATPTVPPEVVIGNPPYVRGDRISKEQQSSLAKALRGAVPSELMSELKGRADLAMTFLAVCLHRLRPGGRLAFVVSQALVESAYGHLLGALAKGQAHIEAVITSPGERWFADAAVHGAVVVARKDAASAGRPTAFVQLRYRVEDLGDQVRGLNDLERLGDVRYAGLLQAPRGALMRGSSEWFDFAKRGKGVLTPLHQIARLCRGMTTGANRFFYPKAGEVEEELLCPVLRSPRYLDSLWVEDTDERVFLAPSELDTLPMAAAYVDAHRELANKPTLRTRKPWWSLRPVQARIFMTKAYDSRLGQFYTPEPMACDQRFYAIYDADCADELLAALLNSVGMLLAVESLGRASMGQGALELAVRDAQDLPVLNPAPFENSPRLGREMVRLFRQVASRPLRSIELEAQAPDRRAFDVCVLGAFFEEPETMAGQLHRALVARVAQRCGARTTPVASPP